VTLDAESLGECLALAWCLRADSYYFLVGVLRERSCHNFGNVTGADEAPAITRHTFWVDYLRCRDVARGELTRRF